MTGSYHMISTFESSLVCLVPVPQIDISLDLRIQASQYFLYFKTTHCKYYTMYNHYYVQKYFNGLTRNV